MIFLQNEETSKLPYIIKNTMYSVSIGEGLDQCLLQRSFEIVCARIVKSMGVEKIYMPWKNILCGVYIIPYHDICSWDPLL